MTKLYRNGSRIVFEKGLQVNEYSSVTLTRSNDKFRFFSGGKLVYLIHENDIASLKSQIDTDWWEGTIPGNVVDRENRIRAWLNESVDLVTSDKAGLVAVKKDPADLTTTTADDVTFTEFSALAPAYNIAVLDLASASGDRDYLFEMEADSKSGAILGFGFQDTALAMVRCEHAAEKIYVKAILSYRHSDTRLKFRIIETNAPRTTGLGDDIIEEVISQPGDAILLGIISNSPDNVSSSIKKIVW
ncbi:hypothetical protein [Vibrio phage BONAISHI]|nr:hypothetical protein [Vibrio phage BONAISHI]